jgi:hypothetical protein
MDGGLNMTIQIDNVDYFFQSEIIEKGWSKSMITKLLGNPDTHKIIKKYGCGQIKTNLFLCDRVVNIETSDEYKLLLDKKEKRSKSKNPEKSQQTKINNILKKFSEVGQSINRELKSENITYKKLVKIAREDINYLAMERNREGMADVDDTRNVHNFIRHWLYDLSGFPKSTKYYDIYRSEIDTIVFDIIHQLQYPNEKYIVINDDVPEFFSVGAMVQMGACV